MIALHTPIDLQMNLHVTILLSIFLYNYDAVTCMMSHALMFETVNIIFVHQRIIKCRN